MLQASGRNSSISPSEDATTAITSDVATADNNKGGVASEKTKWGVGANAAKDDDQTRMLIQQLEEELQNKKDANEELEQKIKALESQTPVMKKLTSFVSTQRALEKENHELRQQLKETAEQKEKNDSSNDVAGNDEKEEELLQQISKLKAELRNAQEKLNNQHLAAASSSEGGFTEEEVNKLLDEEQEKFRMEIEALKEEHGVQMNVVEQEKKALQDQLQQQAMTNQIDAVQLQAAEIKTLREGHAKEMDEILAQLDLVEAEHREEMERLQTFADEQQTMVTALSHELAGKSGSHENSNTALELQQELSEAKVEAQNWQDQCLQTKAHYKQLLDEERQHTIEEADRARQETIQEAEAQFQQANDLYISLKKEYAECKSEKHHLEEELDTVHQHHTVELQELEQKLRQQMDELQQGKKSCWSIHVFTFVILQFFEYFFTDATHVLDLTNVQNAALHDKQYFKDELRRFQESYDAIVEELEEAKQHYHALEKTYALTIVEKERLLQENADLKGVCEETMALLEQYQTQDDTVNSGTGDGSKRSLVGEGESEKC